MKIAGFIIIAILFCVILFMVGLHSQKYVEIGGHVVPLIGDQILVPADIYCPEVFSYEIIYSTQDVYFLKYK